MPDEEPLLRPKEDEGASRRPGYLAISRGVPASLLFLLPLLALYEIGVLAIGADTNAMAPVARWPFFVFGEKAALAFNLAVMIAVLIAFFALRRKGGLRWSVFPVMFVEAVFWGALLAPFLQLLLSGRFAPPVLPLTFDGLGRKAVAAAGSGAYEEIVFRFFLLGGLWLIGTRVLKMKRGVAAVVSLLLAAVIFSVFHFVDPLTTDFTQSVHWDWPLFYYRFAAGASLGALYLWRGLGIVAYAHAVYNILVFCTKQ